ncbi:uncharacterized protein LOC128215192 [Mya arenaria]|uniref:uncharacterized protein LOC128215192 n=1 Tax=Mya arenaria TaxID=6604 RepID=UPI0022E21E96|nr:uncharacterized protein LOC128215192 [Mya arenaria]
MFHGKQDGGFGMKSTDSGTNFCLANETNSLSWQNVYDLSIFCEEKLTEIIKDVNEGRFLPPVGLALLQQHLGRVLEKRHPGINKHHNASLSIPALLDLRLKEISKRDITVLTLGELNAGKSTFLNILLGGMYIPTARQKTTNIVCHLQHSHDRNVEIFFTSTERKHSLVVDLTEDKDCEGWAKLRQCIQYRRFDDQEVKRVIIKWPMLLVEGMFGDLQQRPVQTNLEVDAKCNGKSFPQTIPKSQRHQREIYNRMITEPTNSSQSERKQVFESTHTDSGVGNEIMSVTSNASVRTEDLFGSPKDQTTQNITHSHEIASDEASSPSSVERQAGDFAVSAESLNSQSSETTPKAIAGDQRGSLSFDWASASSPSSVSEESIGSGDDSDTGDVPFRVRFLDCPGIHEHDEEKHVVQLALDETQNSKCFVFILDTSNGPGITKNVETLIEDIKEKLSVFGKELSSDNLLFVANKTDRYDGKKEDIKREVYNEAKKTWPQLNIRPDHVIPLSSTHILKAVAKGQSTPIDALNKELRTFLKQATQVYMEDTLLWLMIILETAKDIAEVACNNHSRSTTKAMKSHLKQIKDEALGLQDIDSKKIQEEKTIIQDAIKSLTQVLDKQHEHIGEHARSALTNVSLDTNVIETSRDWKETLRKLDMLIFEKMEIHVRGEIDVIRETFQEKMQYLYQEEHETLAKLKKSLQGLNTTDQTDTTLIERVLAILTPTTLSLGVRVAPVFFPFFYLALPTLPLWLIGMSVYDEIQDNRQEHERQIFERDRREYVKRRFDNLLENMKENYVRISKQVGSGSLPSIAIKGNVSFKLMEVAMGSVQIKQTANELTDLIDFLQKGDLSVNESSTKSIRKLHLEITKHYACVSLAKDFENLHRFESKAVNTVTESPVEREFPVCRQTKTCRNGKDYMDVELKWMTDALDVDKPRIKFGYRECVMLREMAKGTSEKIAQLFETTVQHETSHVSMGIIILRGFCAGCQMTNKERKSLAILGVNACDASKPFKRRILYMGNCSHCTL